MQNSEIEKNTDPIEGLSEAKVEYDYMAKVSDLFEIWQSPDCQMEDKWVEGLIKTRPQIAEISEHVTQTGMFKDAAERYEGLKSEWEAEPNLTERLNIAYNHFLNKVATAPTRIHLRAAVILCLPLLLSVLDQYIDGQRQEKV